VLVASRLGYEYQLALSAVPRRALGNDVGLVFYSSKECAYLIKHLSPIVCIVLLLSYSASSFYTPHSLTPLLL